MSGASPFPSGYGRPDAVWADRQDGCRRSGGMSLRMRWGLCGAVITLMLLAPVARADSSAEQRSLEEVRNTVINLLQALVERGLLTRDQAQQLVRQAQEKAAADAAAQSARNAAQAKEE